MPKFKIQILTLFLLYSFSITAQNAQKWVDSIYNSLTDDEKIGQLFMIRAHSNLGEEHINEVKNLITNHKPGGLCFFQGNPEKQIELINVYQKLSKVPLMIAMDAEWGLEMRFKKDGMAFPKNLTLGAIQDNQLLYEMGKDMARQLKMVGVQVNFAPVADINNNPNNPVINTRSFGENRENVTEKSIAIMQGMQENGVMACAKHFPGHGDTDVDSHLDLPVIPHSRERLDSIEIYPFKHLAKRGIASMMVAHLHVPIIDDRENIPTTLSAKAIKEILIKELGFDGLIFTDGLRMKGVAKHHKPGAVSAKAFMSGNDVLLLPEDFPLAKATILQYIKDKKITWDEVEHSVKKILLSKYEYGISKFTPLSNPSNLRNQLENAEALVLKRKLYSEAITLVRNDGYKLPIDTLKGKNFASLAIGSLKKTTFQQFLSKYTKIDHFNTSKSVKLNDYINKLKKYDHIFISLHDVSSYASKNYGFTPELIGFVNQLSKLKSVTLIIFGTPYSAKHFNKLGNLIVSYQEDEMAMEQTAQAIFGAIGFKGKLPITASPNAKFNQGVSTHPIFRLKYDLPESVFVNGDFLEQKIDSLANHAISIEATPGIVVQMIKNNTVIYQKAYGYHTYSKKIKTKTSDIFDIASITKVAGSTMSLMKMYEENKIDLSKPLSKYLPELKNTNKENSTLIDIYTHRARWYPWIKFYKKTLISETNPFPNKKYFSSKKTKKNTIEVTEKLFLDHNFIDTIFNDIYNVEMLEKEGYKYSDLGMYFIPKLTKKLTRIDFPKFLNQTYYQSLGLQTIGFNPLKRFSKSQIPPTEEDKYFRQQRVHGYVHDMGAAMLGGVSGHAGLFSSATDLSILFQMLLNKGFYGNKRYLKPETIEKFTTRCKNCTRRGIGFDMLQLDKEQKPNFSTKASTNTFGHLGFTGTAVWADPDHDIITIFLSNRTFPSMFNKKLGKEDYRPKVQEALYEAMDMYNK